MTVAELVAKLQAFPADMPVVCYDDDYAMADLVMEPRVVRFFRMPSKLNGFRDSIFEGEPEAVDKARGAGAPFDAVALGAAP